MELTDTAIVHATKRTGGENPQFIRVGVTGGGCVGYEYYIEYATEIANNDKIGPLKDGKRGKRSTRRKKAKPVVNQADQR